MTRLESISLDDPTYSQIENKFLNSNLLTSTPSSFIRHCNRSTSSKSQDSPTHSRSPVSRRLLYCRGRRRPCPRRLRFPSPHCSYSNNSTDSHSTNIINNDTRLQSPQTLDPSSLTESPPTRLPFVYRSQSCSRPSEFLSLSPSSLLLSQSPPVFSLSRSRIRTRSRSPHRSLNTIHTRRSRSWGRRNHNSFQHTNIHSNTLTFVKFF